jgi:hypothetical protein
LSEHLNVIASDESDLDKSASEHLNVIASHESNLDELQTCEEGESHQFAWEFRVMLVSAFWMLPGTLFGILLRLCVPEGGPVEWWLLGGSMLGAFIGGTVEADHWTS